MIHDNPLFSVPARQRLAGWLVHLFTASGAYVGLLALLAIAHHQLLSAFWLMFVAILIDAVDGMFARAVKIKIAVPEIDGALLDNIVDFLNYSIVPCFFLMMFPLVPSLWSIPCVLAIVLASCYQFSQVDAKTADHFFKGFPSYWNIVIFYLFLWGFHPIINMCILCLLALLSFVPIKYVYPSRLDFLTHNALLRVAMLIATIVWGIATAGLLWNYPVSSPLFSGVSMGYLLLYFTISLYRTWVPLAHASSEITA